MNPCILHASKERMVSSMPENKFCAERLHQQSITEKYSCKEKGRAFSVVQTMEDGGATHHITRVNLQ